jgi:hypothetical protein
MKQKGYINITHLCGNYHIVDIYYDKTKVLTVYGVCSGLLKYFVNILEQASNESIDAFTFFFVNKLNSYKPMKTTSVMSDKIRVMYSEPPGYGFFLDKYIIEPKLDTWFKQYPDISCDIWNGKYAVSLMSKKEEIEKEYNIVIDKMFVTPLGKIFLKI